VEVHLSKQLTALGANIFAGGFTVGVSRHFKVLAHMEHDDEYGWPVVKANFPRLPLLHLPLDKVADGHYWRSKINGQRINFIYSNPPCAIWSMGGKRSMDWENDPRVQRIRDIHSLIPIFQPEVWCWESVCRAFTTGWPLVDHLAAVAWKMGYCATVVLVDAQYLGTPQSRRRFFLVLHRVELNLFEPDWNFVVTVRDALKKITPTRDELKKARRIAEKFKPLLAASKPDTQLSHTFDAMHPRKKPNKDGRVIGRPGFMARRLPLDRPSGVVIGSELFHPTQARRLTIREQAALCGFPPGYDFAPAGNDAYNQIARGVCPTVGEWLARGVKRSILERRPAQFAKTVIDLRKPPKATYVFGNAPSFSTYLEFPQGD
jgi:site-specific DNA-cytosine methylase